MRVILHTKDKYMKKTMLVAPSLLSADFLNLGKEVETICATTCDYLHIDVMDGHFVPNLTIGPLVVEKIAKIATKPLDIHLMTRNSEFFVKLFAPLKPAFLSVHIEEVCHLDRLIEEIKSQGIKSGVVLNPHTSLENLRYILPKIDLVLLMSVNPGFGGQKFIPYTLQKLRDLRILRDELNPQCLIEIDGGISAQNIVLLKENGADMVVAGSYIFGAKDYYKAVESLRI